MKNIIFPSFMLLSILWSCRSTQTINDSANNMLALGDSYTIGESVPSDQNFPNQFISIVQKNGQKWNQPTIIARTGWRTDQLMQAIEEQSDLKKSYELVTLLIGVNNEYQGEDTVSYRPEFEALLKKAISLANNDPEKVWVLSIPDYGYTPFGKRNQSKISARLDAYNAVNAEVAKRFGVHYLNITNWTREGFIHPEYIATDGLHPSGEMYKKWAMALSDSISKQTR